MLEQRAAGEEPDFDRRSCSSYGDFFPENPQTLDELLEQMAQLDGGHAGDAHLDDARAAGQLQDLANQLMEDMDLRWQIDQLGPQPAAGRSPHAGWDRRYELQGDDPLAMSADAGAARRASATSTSSSSCCAGDRTRRQLAEVDVDQVRELLGDDAARSLERLAELAKMLEEAGLIEQREGRYELTPRGLRKIGQNALADLFKQALKDRSVGHELEQTGIGHERATSTKPYEFGDPFNLNIERTIRNAIGARAAGTPVRLTPDDFEIEPHRDAHAAVDRADARPVAVDAHARQLPAGQEGRHGAALADLDAVPARLPRHRRVLERRPRARSPGSCPRCRGTSATAPTCSTR